MEYGVWDLIRLIGSLGLFLYGMKVMSEGLQKVAGDRMRSILSAMTSNRFLGVFTGILVTALVQSSSATTLMTVSFVNAGLLNLAQSISVIMGANIGTTVTAWIISLLGFKVDISAFAIPLFAAAIPLIFSKRTKWNSWGEFVIGFSLLFLGLQFLKSSMPDLQSNPDALAFLQKYTNMGFMSVLIFLFIGAVMTVVVQSSSATVAITLIMCSKGWIPFEMATAMILGENIGTTITANLAALNANVVAKRTAFSHFLFNILGVTWILCIFFPFTNFVADIVAKSGTDPRLLFSYIGELSNTYSPSDLALITSHSSLANANLQMAQEQLLSMAGSISVGLALFHTFFNVANVLIMVWFVNVYVYICERVIRPRKSQTEERPETHLQFLSSRMLSTSELSLLQVHKEIASYGRRTLDMLEMDKTLIVTKDKEEFEQVFNRIEKFENICDRVEVEIVNYLNKLSDGDLSSETKEEVRIMMRVATEIESLGDTSFNIARTLKKQGLNGCTFSPQLEEQLLQLHDIVMRSAKHMVEVLEISNPTADAVHKAYNIENEIDHKRDFLKAKNMQDLDNHVYPYQESVYYLDVIDEYEHFGDYALNVVQAVVEKKV
ncbi:Na/Pi cotransporter [Porphyromonas gingivicanis]|uniref:Na/Pi cotransporter n=1 Tax=Porphyromonas gingivicanis TaxID=266762 RepID=A0A0A2G4L3_9PORP|nr:Na/Pi cotransporter family protein [Porphyromonas gingivicanis]KGN98201.1 Na/Pi cotransporter [Porphyromonas gingivicanis]